MKALVTFPPNCSLNWRAGGWLSGSPRSPFYPLAIATATALVLVLGLGLGLCSVHQCDENVLVVVASARHDAEIHRQSLGDLDGQTVVHSSFWIHYI